MVNEADEIIVQNLMYQGRGIVQTGVLQFDSTERHRVSA